ncbi:lipoprotein [Fictibacillus macauensis ZFHKF-1]|uniref:Lipoprotein n=1 Tax=Fictibacillus macauensis ZFHKF-1 TaxID=1196324 RepID=I8UBG8_9BACL|nr:DUF1672 family protein [Fictibacillus macauensis]EIT84285.1 lipoprotein [Fictibacillus macauensis ZFHKF-1]
MKYAFLIMSIVLVLAGCGGKSEQTESPYIPVQDYTGQGYELHNGEKYVEFAKEHRAEVEKLVKAHFRNKYKSDVTVHNVVGAQDAVVAQVEAIGSVNYHTYVILPIVSDQLTGKVVGEEGELEGAIVTSLYGQAYQKEFQVLDTFCKEVSNKYPVIGISQAAIDNTKSFGIYKPFYRVSLLDMYYPEIFKLYRTHSKVTSKELDRYIRHKKVDKKYVSITLGFYMKQRHAAPDANMLKKIYKEFKQKKGFPPGNYTIFLNSNEIQKATAIEKSYESSNPLSEDVMVIQ